MITATPPANPENYYISAWSFATLGTTVYAGMSAFGLYRSTDLGETWTQITSDVSTNEERLSFTFRDDTLYTAGTSSGVFISTDNGGFWEEHLTNLYTDINSLLFIDDVLYAGHGFQQGASRSTDGGRTWTRVAAGMPAGDRWVYELAASGSTVLARTAATILSSSDSGNTWTDLMLPTAGPVSLFADGPLVLSSTTNELYRSTNSGQTWTEITNGVPATVASYDFARIGNTLFMGGGTFPRMHMSTDDGLSWSPTGGVINDVVRVLATAGDTLYAATDFLCYYSTDLGQTWVFIPSSGIPPSTLRYRALMAKNGYLYAGMGGGGYSAYRMPIPGTTSVEPMDDVLPTTTKLLQNYPNPFNAETTIRFEITERAYVTLTVYDVLGQEVERLVRETLSPGSYLRRWSPGGLPSGVYLLNLNAGGFHETRRIVLLR
jgi:photosystem II stability/assembly factor-like uncharacterized protein